MNSSKFHGELQKPEASTRFATIGRYCTMLSTFSIPSIFIQSYLINFIQLVLSFLVMLRNNAFEDAIRCIGNISYQAATNIKNELQPNVVWGLHESMAGVLQENTNLSELVL